jgi:hypothetical protein
MIKNKHLIKSVNLKHLYRIRRKMMMMINLFNNLVIEAYFLFRLHITNKHLNEFTVHVYFLQ